jgi:hypothetical protein
MLDEGRRLTDEIERQARDNDNQRRYIERLSDFVDASSDSRPFSG